MSSDITWEDMTQEEKFNYWKCHKPQPGDIISTRDGNPIPVYVEIRKVRSPRGISENRLMYCTALIDDTCTGWYLGKDPRGLKVLLLPQTQAELIRRHGGRVEFLQVEQLRVVRYNKNETALLCELVDLNER